MSQPYKMLEAKLTPDIDRVLYSPERVTTLGGQCSQENSPFAVTDRMGLISDVTQLGKSGLMRTSAGLSLIDTLRSDTDCKLRIPAVYGIADDLVDLVWDSIATRIAGICEVWWEMSDATRNDMNAFRRVRFMHFIFQCVDPPELVSLLATGQEVWF